MTSPDAATSPAGPTAAADAGQDGPLGLLQEWMTWWRDCDGAPAKLPRALQVRTAVALTEHGHPVYLDETGAQPR